MTVNLVPTTDVGEDPAVYVPFTDSKPADNRFTVGIILI